MIQGKTISARKLCLTLLVGLTFLSGTNAVAGAPNKPGSIAFDFVISDAGGIRSDGLGQYFSGVANISSNILSSGSWQAAAAYQRRPDASTRRYAVDLSNPVDIGAPFSGLHTGTGQMVLVNAASIPVGGTGQLRFEMSWNEASGNYILSFGKAAGDGTLPVDVSHPDVNTYVISTQPVTDGDLALVSINSTSATRHLYHLPVSITLTKH